MEYRVAFTGRSEAALESFDPAEVGPHQVGVRGICSLISTGTENICFNRLFAEGTHWDTWVNKYPFHPGYSFIGRVDAVGDDVPSPQVGDIVALRRGHASYHVIDADSCVVVPQGLEPRDAAWFALAKIAFMGARAAGHKLGDPVLVIGAGPIGQMAVRWAVAAGAYPVVVIDPVAFRLDLARQGGATHVLAASADACLDDVRQACDGALPGIVIDSTGHAAVFQAALGLAADRGRVVILGDTGFPGDQRLTPDVIRRGLSIVGAHDMHIDDVWNDKTIPRLFFRLLQSGRFSVSGLNTHRFGPEECPEAYALLNTRRGETMGVLFDWSG